MSRLGKKLIAIPSGVTVEVVDSVCTVRGPLGELSRDFSFPNLSISKQPEGIATTVITEDKATKAMWGTVAAHVKNMIAGVVKAYEKKLLIEGVGYKWDVKGTDIVLSLGFSHPVKIAIPKGVKVIIDNKGVMAISGIDKELIGEFAARVRALRKPEPYKGKGIRYENEIIRRKQGKKTV